MGPEMVQPRATKFLKLLAQQLCRDTTWFSSSTSLSSNLENALRRAVEDLPAGSLRSSLQTDVPSLVAVLEREIKLADPSLGLGLGEIETSQKEQVLTEKLPEQLLALAQGSLLTESAYARAVEAAVLSIKKGYAKSCENIWRETLVRLLQSRRNLPLSLWWAFATFERDVLSSGEGQNGIKESTVARISVGRRVLHSMKTMTAGCTSGPTSVATLAPVVCIALDALKSFSDAHSALTIESDLKLSKKEIGKMLRKLKDFFAEISAFVSLCHHKTSISRGVCSGRSEPKFGLDIWFSEDPQLSTLFPLATARMESTLRKALKSSEMVPILGDFVATEVAVLRLVVEVVCWRNHFKQQTSPDVGRHELERKLKQIMFPSAGLLCSSESMLGVLLNCSLGLYNILDDEEEGILRGVLVEAVVAQLPFSGLFNKERLPVLSKRSLEKECVVMLKKIAIFRQAAAHFRSKGEHIRAETIMAGLLSKQALSQLGRWLSVQDSVKQVPSATVFQQPSTLMDWLIKAKDDDFEILLKRASNQPVGKPGHNAPSEAVANVDTDDMIFFIDTKGIDEGAEGKEVPGADLTADHALVMAAENMRGMGASTEDSKRDKVLYQRVNQAERKRSREQSTESDSEDEAQDDDVENSERKNMSIL